MKEKNQKNYSFREMDRRHFLKSIGILTGITLSTATLGTLLNSCGQKRQALTLFERDFGFASRKHFVLDAKKFYEIVDELTEIIIPTTDTPGAKDARVVDFIDSMISVVYEEKEREAFLEGLAHTDTLAQSMFQNTFVRCSEQEKIEVVKRLEEESMEKKSTFFDTIKGLTIAGFFSSEMGASQVLKHIDVPGRYETVPYTEVGRAWSQ